MTTPLASAASADIVQVGQVPTRQRAPATAGSTTYTHGRRVSRSLSLVRSHPSEFVRIPSVQARGRACQIPVSRRLTARSRNDQRPDAEDPPWPPVSTYVRQ